MSDRLDPQPTPARRRRQNVPGGRGRTGRSHRVLVSEEEAARLAELAAEQGVTVPRLLVESALAGVGETPTQRRAGVAELFALRRTLAGVANNVNQLARYANTEERLALGTAAALEDVRRLADQLEHAVDVVVGS